MWRLRSLRDFHVLEDLKNTYTAAWQSHGLTFHSVLQVSISGFSFFPMYTSFLLEDISNANMK